MNLYERAKSQLDDINCLPAADIPPMEVQLRAKSLVDQLGSVGAGIYNVCPGPNREVSVEIRNRSRTLEIIFYPQPKVDKWVKFEHKSPEGQGEYNDTLLPSLIDWLHA